MKVREVGGEDSVLQLIQSKEVKIKINDLKH